jgi:cyclase
MSRLLIVGKINPGAEARLAQIFAESDETELPSITGTRHRSLYSIGDLYVHLVEMDGYDPAAMQAAHGHPLFVRLSERLSACTSPYLPNSRSPRDAMAQCFYRWEAPVSVPEHG